MSGFSQFCAVWNWYFAHLVFMIRLVGNNFFFCSSRSYILLGTGCHLQWTSNMHDFLLTPHVMPFALACVCFHKFKLQHNTSLNCTNPSSSSKLQTAKCQSVAFVCVVLRVRIFNIGNCSSAIARCGNKLQDEFRPVFLWAANVRVIVGSVDVLCQRHSEQYMEDVQTVCLAETAQCILWKRETLQFRNGKYGEV